MGETTIGLPVPELTATRLVGDDMTANSQQIGSDQNITPELLHETNYAIEVLEKEFPKASRQKIELAIQSARSSAGVSADRWQILHHARRSLSTR